MRSMASSVANRARALAAEAPNTSGIAELVQIAVSACGGNQAEMARQLGVTRATVSRWSTGRSVPDEGSCLRLARLTGRGAAEVFRLAGHDPQLLPGQWSTMTIDHAVEALVQRWTQQLGGLSDAERAAVIGVVDDMVHSLTRRLGSNSGHVAA